MTVYGTVTAAAEPLEAPLSVTVNAALPPSSAAAASAVMAAVSGSDGAMVKVWTPPAAMLGLPWWPPTPVRVTVKVSADSFRLSAVRPMVMAAVARPPAAVTVTRPAAASLKSAAAPVRVASTSAVSAVLPSA